MFMCGATETLCLLSQGLSLVITLIHPLVYLLLANKVAPLIHFF